MPPSARPDPDTLRLALGPLGHRINHPLGTARLAIDLARGIAASSDRAAELAGPLADVARCIDDAGRVTRALQRLAHPGADALERGSGAAEPVDWCELVRESADAAGLPAPRPTPPDRPLGVRVPVADVRTLIAGALRSLAGEDELELFVDGGETHARLLARTRAPRWDAERCRAFLDPFGADDRSGGRPGGRFGDSEDLVPFIARTVCVRLGGRLELRPTPPGATLALELPLDGREPDLAR